MKKVPAKLLITAATLMLVCGTGIPSAHAITSQICGNGGSGYCINAWNGGPVVKMYYGGVTNDNFTYRPVYICSGTDRVQSTASPHNNATNCPFSNTGIDNTLAGAEIVEIEDLNNSQCVGTGDVNGRQDAGYEGSCGSTTGVGAIQGAFDVLAFEGPDGNGSCIMGNFLVNRYWTNTYGTNQLAFVQSGGNPNTNLLVGAVPPFNTEPTCWG
jgi:hypothetical protein